MPTILVPLADGFEEIEAITPVDLLRRAGAEVVTASLADGIHVSGRTGVTVHADASLSLVRDRDFDCLFLPGGPGVSRLRADPRVLELVRRQHAADRWLAAICAAPVILQDAGVLGGRRYTAHFSVAGELPDILSGERVVTDGRLLTSRGAGTALDFALLLVEKLFSPKKADEIRLSVCG